MVNQTKLLTSLIAALFVGGLAPTSQALGLTSADGTPWPNELDGCDGANYVIPPLTRVEFSEELTVSVPCDIVIFGSLVGRVGTGADVELVAGRRIIIVGVVAGADGYAPEPVMADDGPLTGANGGDGGDVRLLVADCSGDVLQNCGLMTFPGSTVRGGNGGIGGAAVVRSPTNQTCLCAVGGNGGAGGNVFLIGSTPSIMFGRVESGRAGDGGRAVAVGPDANALGGTGGSAGFVGDPTWPVLSLIEENSGFTGGSGGDAFAATAADEGMEQWLIPGVPGVFGVGACGDATGTPGSDGLYGGQGGSADAEGCPQAETGTNGPSGAGGPACQEFDTRGFCIRWSGGPERGGDGGEGPQGSPATGTGGKGGTGLMAGGTGGQGHGTGGQGGAGGQGGRGGDTWMTCVKGGDGGNGGKGGKGGLGTGTGGNGGDVILVVGRPGDGGVGMGTGGSPGGGGPGGAGGSPAPFQIGVSEPTTGIGAGCSPPSGNPGTPGPIGDQGEHEDNRGDPGGTGSMTPVQLGYLLCDTAGAGDRCRNPAPPCPSGTAGVTEPACLPIPDTNQVLCEVQDIDGNENCEPNAPTDPCQTGLFNDEQGNCVFPPELDEIENPCDSTSTCDDVLACAALQARAADGEAECPIGPSTNPCDYVGDLPTFPDGECTFPPGIPDPCQLGLLEGIECPPDPGALIGAGEETLDNVIGLVPPPPSNPLGVVQETLNSLIGLVPPPPSDPLGLLCGLANGCDPPDDPPEEPCDPCVGPGEPVDPPPVPEGPDDPPPVPEAPEDPQNPCAGDGCPGVPCQEEDCPAPPVPDDPCGAPCEEEPPTQDDVCEMAANCEPPSPPEAPDGPDLPEVCEMVVDIELADGESIGCDTNPCEELIKDDDLRATCSNPPLPGTAASSGAATTSTQGEETTDGTGSENSTSPPGGSPEPAPDNETAPHDAGNETQSAGADATSESANAAPAPTEDASSDGEPAKNEAAEPAPEEPPMEGGQGTGTG